MGVHTGFGELVIRGEALDHFEFVSNSRRTEINFCPGLSGFEFYCFFLLA